MNCLGRSCLGRPDLAKHRCLGERREKRDAAQPAEITILVLEANHGDNWASPRAFGRPTAAPAGDIPPEWYVSQQQQRQLERKGRAAASVVTMGHEAIG